MTRLPGLLGTLFLLYLETKGEDFEGIPLTTETEADIFHHRESRLQDILAKEIGEANRELDDQEDFDSIESRLAEEEDLIDYAEREIKTRKSRVKSRKSQPPVPPTEKSQEMKLKGKTDDMMPQSKEQEIKRSLRYSQRRRLQTRGKKKDKKAKRGRKRQDASWPKTLPYNMDTLNGHPNGAFRPGFPTTTHSCDKVTTVPKELRAADFYNGGINKFYSKYTEAYGIPVIGSSDVTDEGLMRACYIVRVMMASRYDIRYAYYKTWGKVAVIGDNEQQTSLYEYRTWDPKYWNQRARGLGPTFTIPLTSVGDDNLRCKAGGRYFDQGILPHELSHAIHKLGASLVIAGFEKRLNEIYKKNVVDKGKWAGSYAGKNVNEYFAVASQFYMNAFRAPGIYEDQFGVHDRTSLRAYDSDISDILDEIHPCAVGNDNFLIHRCDWKLKDCGLSNFELRYELKYAAKSRCPHVKQTNKNSAAACATAACYYGGNVFNWVDNTCIIVQCEKTVTKDDLAISQAHGTYYVYVLETPYELTLEKEKAQKVKMHCTNGPSGTSDCDNVVDAIPFANPGTSKSECKEIGGCWIGGQCVYPVQDCVDVDLYCHEWAKLGECERNPGFMYRECQQSCGICDRVADLDIDELVNMCQDKNVDCKDWAKSGECQRNPGWMNRNCKISCGICNDAYDPLKK